MTSNLMYCDDCQTPTTHRVDPEIGPLGIAEFYMVTTQTWFRTYEPKLPDGSRPYPRYLCIECLEARIGFTLTAGDFMACPMNFDPKVRRSARLLDRMTRTFPDKA